MKQQRLVLCTLLPTLLVPGLTGCGGGGATTAPAPPADPTSSRATFVRTVGTQEIASLWAGEPAALAVIRYAIDVYSIVYETVDPGGRRLEASGALYVPKAAGPFPLLSVQHGTFFLDASSPSLDGPTSVGRPAYLVASAGYVTAVADFLGYGRSTQLLHPYVHADSLASACLDMLRAAKAQCSRLDIALDDRLFLTGYSEGGYATIALQRAIESGRAAEFTLTAVTAGAGPYDLPATARSFLQDPDAAVSDPENLAFVLVAYHRTYGMTRDLGEIFNEPYATRLEQGLLDGDHDALAVRAQLHSVPSTLLTAQFLADFRGEGEQEYKRRFSENSLAEYVPRAPLQLYHGDADRTVPYANSVALHQFALANGATNVELVTVGGGDHGGAALPWGVGTAQFFAGFW